MIEKLRRKFVYVSLTSVSVMLLILMGILNSLNYITTVDKADRTLMILFDNGGRFPEPVEPMAEDDMMHKPPLHGMDKDLKHFSAETPFESRYFSVTFDSNGNVSATDTASIAAVTKELAEKHAASARESGKESGFIGNYRFRSDGFMVVFLDCTRDIESFRSLLFISLGVAVAGLFFVFIFSLFFSNIALKPVMQSYMKQKRFITDASHEIRTPLTIIDANTEVIEMTSGKTEWTRSIRSQITRLSELTKSLVSLSRMDEGNGSFNPTEFSLSDALEEVGEQFDSSAMRSHKKFEKVIEHGITMKGDETQIRQLISILLDNAMKYSNPEGWIKLEMGRNGHKASIAVSNSVESAIKGEHDQVFDRFMRMDSSRTHSTPGYGLGLSIAQSIVLRHKGRISAFSPDERTFCLKAILPIV